VWGCWAGRGEDGAYCVLVRVEAAVVESCVGVAHGDGEGGPRGVGLEVVDQIEVVGSEIRVSKRRVCWHWVSVGAAAGRAGVEGGSNGQYGGVGVVERGMDSRSCGIVPDDIHRVFALVVGVFRLAIEIDWAGTGDVDLFGVVSWQD